MSDHLPMFAGDRPGIDLPAEISEPGLFDDLGYILPESDC